MRILGLDNGLDRDVHNREESYGTRNARGISKGMEWHSQHIDVGTEYGSMNRAEAWTRTARKKDECGGTRTASTSAA